MDAPLGLQIWAPRWGYKYGRPAGATNMDAPMGLQTWTPRWGYKYYRPAGATNIIAPLGLQLLLPRWGWGLAGVCFWDYICNSPNEIPNGKHLYTAACSACFRS